MQQTIIRENLLQVIETRLNEFPCVALLGARQVGKTTLARQFAERHGGAVRYFDLEDLRVFASLQAAPQSILEEQQEGLVIIDEIQRLPVLFQVLRPVCDMPGRKSRFLLLGSASWELVRGVSESLAGRISFVDVAGFSLNEIDEQQDKLWLRGGFPPAFLAANATAHRQWHQDFFTTFVRRDISALADFPGGAPMPALFERFWQMLAHCHGQLWNASALAQSLNISQPSLVRYRDLLNASYMLRVLQPWFENNGKRLVKSPKIYFRDSGLLHFLLNIFDMTALRLDPHCGASWEGFALEQALTAHGGREAYFYATHRGAELDLLLPRNGKLWGFEFKSADAPSTTKSMHIALQDLKLEHLYVVHPGAYRYPLADKITALPLAEVAGLPLR